MKPSSTPRFFVDRNLGSRLVPSGLRDHGWAVITMDERYGTDRSQTVSDVDWIADACEAGECLLTSDAAIARRPAEAAVIFMHSARAFVPARGGLTGPAKLSLLLANEGAILRWARRAPGPFVASVGPSGLRRLRINYPTA
jgi:hypothetical protein